jgi:hypothetical protein
VEGNHKVRCNLASFTWGARMANIRAGVHSHLSVTSGSSQVDGRDRSSGMYLRFKFCPWTSGPSTTIRFLMHWLISATMNDGSGISRHLFVHHNIDECMGRRRHSQAAPNACEPFCSYWVATAPEYPYPSRGSQQKVGTL